MRDLNGYIISLKLQHG